MKIFKRVYYPVMAALVVLMLVLGIVDSRVGMSGGSLKNSQVDGAVSYAEMIAGITGDDEEKTKPHNSYNVDAQQRVRDYILETLKNAGAQEVLSDELDDDGKNVVDYFERSGEKQPSVYVQKAAVTQGSQGEDNTDIAVSRTVENIILAFPGSGSDAIMLHARYDGPALGGASDAAATGALLQTAVDALKSGASYKNTVVFLFGDAGQEGDLGACAFVKQFAGFDGVAAKVRAVADFRAGGTSGTLMMYGSGTGSLDLVGKYSRFNGSTFVSGALSMLTANTEYAGSGVFGDYSTLNFTNRGGFNKYATADDISINKKLVSQQANAMNKFVKCYSDAKINNFDSKASGTYFSYLDVMTVYYPAAVAFVIAGIILGLAIAIIILNARNKTFSWGKALAGAAVQIVALLATALTSFALYYLFALLLSGFGVIPFRGLSSVKFAGTGLLISASVLAIAVAIFFYILLKRTFAVKAADVVRGNALIFALAAFILSFAVPAISYPFTCVALFSLTAMLMTVIFKNKFRAKFGMDIERLFLYVWAVVFALPLVMPLFFAAQTLYSAVSIVVIATLMASLAGFIAPYADYLKPTLDKVFKKLPARTVRYERLVTEKVEDRAKKGKFTEVTVKKVFKEKESWSYLNRIGLSFVAVLSAVMIVLFCSFGTTFSSAAVSASSYYDSIYDDSLLFVYEKNGSAAAEVSVEVHDKIAYNYIRYAVGDLNWNERKDAYVKEYTASYSNIIPSTPSVSKNDEVISFSTFDSDKSQITVTLKGANAVKKVSFKENASNSESEEYEFDDKDEITFRLPFGYSDFEMTVDASCEVVFEQHIFNDSNLINIEGGDWQKLDEYYAANKQVAPAIRRGIVIKITQTF